MQKQFDAMLKRFILKALDDVVIPIVNVIVSKRIGGVIPEVMDRVARDSADYCERHMASALMFMTRERLWSYALRNAPEIGIGLEFGVFEGYSLNFFAERRTNQRFVGFDSFIGLKEDWTGWQYTRGHFDKGGEEPKVRGNVTLVKGWFDETLPPFIEKLQETIAFVHIDCDTYESTRDVLERVGPKLSSGAVLVFDEYFGYRGWRDGEFRAWAEFVQQSSRTYKYLGFSNMAVAIQLVD